MTDRRVLAVLAARGGAAACYVSSVLLLRAGGLAPWEWTVTVIGAVVALTVVASAGWVANGARRDD